MHDTILYIVIAVVLIDIIVGWLPTKSKRMKTLSKIEDLENDINSSVVNLFKVKEQENFIYAKQSFKNGGWIVKLNTGEYIKLTDRSFNSLFNITHIER